MIFKWKKLLFALIATFLFQANLSAQVNIGNSTPPTPGSILDLSQVEEKNQGLMLPQVSISDLSKWPLQGVAVDGMVVYNTNTTTCTGVYYWKTDQWIVADNAGLLPGTWSLTGNAGTNMNTHFIGTTDNIPIVLYVNRLAAGYTGGPNNTNASFGRLSMRYPTLCLESTSMGTQAFENSRTNARNVAIGEWAIERANAIDNVAIGSGTMAKSKTDSLNRNIAIGLYALMNNNTSENIAIGSEAMIANVTGVGNIGIGLNAFRTSTVGSYNIAVGHNSLRLSTTDGSVAIGFEALTNNATATHNVTIGFKAMHQNTTGEYNTAIGAQTMYVGQAGSRNVAIGSGALCVNTTGSDNSGIGISPLWFNETGSENVAIGEEALGGNIDGNYNTAAGSRALYSAKDHATTYRGEGHASNNTVVGFEAVFDITYGGGNTASGLKAMRWMTTGEENTVMGVTALFDNSSGSRNVALGFNGMSLNFTGSNNTGIGYRAGVYTDGLTNAAAIGSSAFATKNNQIRVGNNNVTEIGGAVAWTELSDRRIKENIRETVPGISFIRLLKPVTYNLTLSDNRTTHSGFIAQDVENAAKSIDYDFSGINIPQNDDLYSLQYDKFVVLLVKAAQEISHKNAELVSRLHTLRQEINELKKSVNQ